jgi:hypothetical protein
MAELHFHTPIYLPVIVIDIIKYRDTFNFLATYSKVHTISKATFYILFLRIKKLKNTPGSSEDKRNIPHHNNELKRLILFLSKRKSTCWRAKELRFDSWEGQQLFSLHNVQTSSEAQASYRMGTVARSVRYSSKGVKLTTHIHLVQRLRIRGAIPPLSCTTSCRSASLIEITTRSF